MPSPEQNFIIKKSSISGSGVFNDKEIKKGQTICFLTGELCTHDEIMKRINEGKEMLSDPLEVSDEEYLDLDEIPRTFNHSCNPNSYIRGKNELIALFDISAGEEITYDYSTTMNDNSNWTCTCNCGGKDCRGIIAPFRSLSKKFQQFYVSNKFMPNFLLKKFE